jgi:hypothetical protein
MHVRVVALAIGLAGCKGEPTDDLPLDKVEHAKLLKEQKQVNAGETVGERLRTPKVVLDAKDVTINGRKVASRSELSAIANVDPIFQWAKGLREHWKSLYPSHDFDPGADVTFPSDASYVEGAALLTTIAHAGFGDNLNARMGTLTVRLTYDIARPLEDATPTPKALVDLSESGGWRARSALDDESFDAVAKSVQGCAPWQPFEISNASAIALGICKKKCDVVIVSGGPSFQSVLELLAIILPSSDPHVRVAFVGTERCK